MTHAKTGLLISRYSRTQAIADGVLRDFTIQAKECGFRCPVAMTVAVWANYVQVPHGVRCQDIVGRLWDILWMLRNRIAAMPTELQPAVGDTLRFRLHVRNDNRGGTPPLVELKAVFGLDDNGSPCITVMMPDED